jgi:Sugar transferases involved in lipopolysaccharide synthesis
MISFFMSVYDPGPIFYRQRRVGRKGILFNMFKFRSMRVDADQIGPHFTSANDPRITKVGRFLRKTSLDELPQLLNVVLGDMSIVGPRPNVAAQSTEYSVESWEKRNLVRPGITGLAQATVRSEATPQQRELLDLEYVDNANFILDMKIILKTAKQVLTKGGN